MIHKSLWHIHHKIIAHDDYFWTIFFFFFFFFWSALFRYLLNEKCRVINKEKKYKINSTKLFIFLYWTVNISNHCIIELTKWQSIFFCFFLFQFYFLYTDIDEMMKCCIKNAAKKKTVQKTMPMYIKMNFFFQLCFHFFFCFIARFLLYK